MIDYKHYITPSVSVVEIIPGTVLCESSFGFQINQEGFIDGDIDSANNGYGSIFNGSY
ncbi:MAG: hypothetical protein ACI4UJ_04435 [Candidatus Cryptobacteroides sp.]